MKIDSFAIDNRTRYEYAEFRLVPGEGLLFLAKVAIMPIDRMIVVPKLGESVYLRSLDPEFIERTRENPEDAWKTAVKTDDLDGTSRVIVPHLSAHLNFIASLTDRRLMGQATIIDGVFEERLPNELGIPD